MSVELGGKPLLSWNTAELAPMKDCNHICMFGKNSLIGDLPAHVNALHASQALFFRLKMYSRPYHDFILSKHQSESTLPAAALSCSATISTSRKTARIFPWP